MISCRSRSRSSVAGREVSLASCGAALRVVGRADDDGPMTVIKINAITVPAEHGEEVARRFAARIGAVDSQAGFEGFELLRPTDDRTTWLVVSRWADQETFDAWLASPSFAHGHRGVQPGGAHPGAEGGAHPGAEDGAPAGERPLSMTAELWSYEIATAATPQS